jgi:DNA methylase
MGGHGGGRLNGKVGQGIAREYRRAEAGVRDKSLIGLPWRYALRCIDDLGLILRRDQIWSKPNGLPESVTDRCRSSHEYWFHLVKQPRYYSAIDHIRQPHAPGDQRRSTIADLRRINPSGQSGAVVRHTEGNPLGALPGSVWEIPTEPLTVPAEVGVDHFAAFPTEWPRRIILGWSPSGICTACGEGRRPVTMKDRQPMRRVHNGRGSMSPGDHNWSGSTVPHRTTAIILGEACACPNTTAPTQPALILDPFGGTGTTALVAHAYGRTGITIDKSADYSRLAAWRTTDRGELAKAMCVDKPPKQLDGQAGLFDLGGVT